MTITKILYIPLLVSCSLSWAQSDVADTMKSLKQTPTFALGQIGFVGHISESERQYRRILQAPDALTLFRTMLADEEATPEAQLYAACGIRALAAREFETRTSALRLSGRTVSVLRADILKREGIQDQLQAIGQYGCNDAYWR